MSDNYISASSSFFRIREESTTKHPKENSLNLKEDLEEKRDTEWRAEVSPLRKILTVRSRNCRRSCLQIFLKLGALKIFLRPATLLKRDSNAGVFLWLLRNLYRFFYSTHLVAASGIKTFYFVIHTTLKIYEDSMTQT